MISARISLSAATLLAAGWLVAQATPAPAFTDDELLSRFEAQRNLFKEGPDSPWNRTRGGTRALTLHELPPGNALDPALLPIAPGAVSTVGAPASPSTSEPGPAPVRAVFAELAPELQINMDIRFALDSADLAADQKPLLAQMCKVMAASTVGLFRIIGHTDSLGPDAYNLQLSQARADAVRRHLTGECGIASDRLEALGVGKQFPLRDLDPAAPENRRVEFQALD